ncbi:MAG: hypothetical protein V7731_16790 [Amphritea sp.]
MRRYQALLNLFHHQYCIPGVVNQRMGIDSLAIHFPVPDPVIQQLGTTILFKDDQTKLIEALVTGMVLSKCD